MIEYYHIYITRKVYSKRYLYFSMLYGLLSYPHTLRIYYPCTCVTDVYDVKTFSTALYHCWLLRVTSYFYFLLLYPCMFEILICLFL